MVYGKCFVPPEDLRGAWLQQPQGFQKLRGRYSEYILYDILIKRVNIPFLYSNRALWWKKLG